MYRLNEIKMFYDIADNQAIVIDSSTGLYYAFNPLASMVFDALAQGADPMAVLERLRLLPNTPESVEEDFHNFITRLLNYEILIADGNSIASVAINLFPMLTQESFAFEFDQFNDAQEIMMADPIHDVDLEMGWPILKNPDEE